MSTFFCFVLIHMYIHDYAKEFILLQYDNTTIKKTKKQKNENTRHKDKLDNLYMSHTNINA